MSEKHSNRELSHEKLARQEIAETLAAPKGREGYHPELADEFVQTTTDTPLTRQEFENEVEQFTDRYFERFVSFITGKRPVADFIREFNLTNEQIGLLGSDILIRKVNGELSIFRTDENNPEGFPLQSDDTGLAELMALAFAKENIRVDSRRDIGKKIRSNIPHRYYLRSKERYLCANDFGMRVYDNDRKQMVVGDVTHASPLIQTLKNQFHRILENFEVAKDKVASPEKKWFGTLKDMDLILNSIPLRKVRDHLHFNFDKVAKKYGFCTDDPVADYRDFETKTPKLEALIREPTEQEKSDVSIPFAYSDFYEKPFINHGDFDRQALISEAKSGVRDVLARRLAETENDQMRKCIEEHQCKRGQGSPYLYPYWQIYEFVKKVGVDKANQVLDKDDRNISEQLEGLKFLQAMGYEVEKMEPDPFRKQLKEAHKLSRSELWKYLEKRQEAEIAKKRKQTGEKADSKHWLALLGKRRAKTLFHEGKRIYWLAQSMWKQRPSRKEDDRFYREDRYEEWSRYDLSKTMVTETKLNEILANNNNLIVSLMERDAPINTDMSSEELITFVTLGLLVSAIESGQDLKGVALAYDKHRYLKGLIGGEVKSDFEFAIADWPAKWKAAVQKEEIELYYEYANDYVLQNPNGLTNYATWRASEEGERWAGVFKEIPKSKSDLDFRLCLSSQTEEIRNWYKEGSEYVGNAGMQNYFLRFNATKGADGKMANWHDVLFWVPNIKKLEPSDAKATLSNIETMDDNQNFVQLLPRFDKTRDPFREHGPIQTLRELRKRVLGIESNIDLSKFPPEVIDITSAPGFNLVELDSMQRRDDFQGLIDGKLDGDQPFKPHRRLFAGRALTEALKEGLGSHKMKIRGTARDAKELFHQLKQLIKGRKSGEKPMEVTDLFQSVPVDLEEEIIRLLQIQNVEIGPLVEAQIHAKSDPEGWVCGNYTDCCMPFGASNNTDYMFNPSTQYFTIKFNGRIVAQSVVVDSKNIDNGTDVVVLDNIEVANNFKHLTPLLANVYRTFWAEYTGKPVKVGTGYSDLTPPGAKLEKNRYEPKTPLYYSDARGDQIYDLPKIRGIEAMDQMVTFANLTERDSELIAKMESEAYPEGMSHGKAHIADMLKKQRDLEVPGAASSFLIRQGKEPAGYLLVLPEESENNPGEKVAHIHDMAVLPKFRGTSLARKMMERVVEIATAYGVAIEAEARASTSYAMLMNDRVRLWLESQGFYLVRNEKMPEYLGGEDFYSVRFENRQNAERLAE